MIELITSFMELLIMLILIGSFTEHKVFQLKNLHFLIEFIFFKSIYIFFFKFMNDEFISFAYNILLSLVIIKYYYRLRITETICTFLCSYIIIVILQVPYVFLYTNVFMLENPNILAISCMLFCIIASIIITYITPAYKIFNLLFKNNKLGILLISNFFMLVVIISMYFKLNRDRFIDMIIFFIVALLMLISINIVAINQFNTIRKQRKQLAAYEEYFPMIDSLIGTVRRRQHHHSNEIQAIMALMYTHKDYNSLVNAINEHLELSKALDMPSYLLKLNMKMLAGFLYMKEQEASKTNRFLIIDVDCFELKSKAPEYILVELLGILIDNALDETPCGEKAYVSISCDNNRIVFRTQNKGFKILSEHRSKFFAPGYSTKNKPFSLNKTHAGIGLPTLKNIVLGQFDGRIFIGNEGPNDDIVFQITI